MTLEQSFFLNILSDHINKRKTTFSSECIDWNRILYYAQIHQLEGIVFFQCKSFLPSEIKIYLEDKYGSSLSIYANQKYYLKRIQSILSKNNIEFFIVKGFPVSSFYPFPPLRTMGDTDLVVHSKDRKQVHNLLLELSYVNESHNEDSVWVYHNGKYELELHDRLIYSKSITRIKHEELFMDFWNYVHNNSLNWNYHLVFLLLHLRNHLINYGVGFRQFLDIAVVTKNNSDLDWIWIEDRLVNLDLIEFSRIVFALNETWFDVKSPIKGIIDSSFFDIATNQVFSNGVFGFENDDNKGNMSVNVAHKCKHAKLSMLVTAIRKVFPNYNEMVSVSKYSFIEGKKWLLPIAWIYRIINGAKKSVFSRNVNIVKNSFITNKSIRKREDYLKHWRLYE